MRRAGTAKVLLKVYNTGRNMSIFTKDQVIMISYFDFISNIKMINKFEILFFLTLIEIMLFR